MRFRWPAPQGNPQPGQAGPGTIRITLLGIRADKIADTFLNGDEDELYVRVFRGVGINERYNKRTDLGDIRAGQTIIPNRVIYDGPAILVDILYVALDFYDDDDASNDDRLGNITVRVQNGQLVWSDGGFEAIEPSGQFAGARVVIT